MDLLLSLALAFTACGAFTIAIDEGRSGFRNIFDFRGTELNVEPIKRAGWHAMLILGLVLLVVYVIAQAIALVR